MKTVLDILQKAGGWRHSLYLKIENPSFMELVIEATDESGPCGFPCISVAHYGQQNGDAMRDPEMSFELDRDSLNPFYWRNDYVGGSSGAATSSAAGTFATSRSIGSMWPLPIRGIVTCDTKASQQFSRTSAFSASPLVWSGTKARRVPAP